MLSNAFSGTQFLTKDECKKSKSFRSIVAAAVVTLLLLVSHSFDRGSIFDLYQIKWIFGKFYAFRTGDVFRFPGICHRHSVYGVYGVVVAGNSRK